MKSQKSFKPNLEKNRFIFFQLGLIIALGAVLGAFEWKSQPRELRLDMGDPIIIDDEIIIRTKPEEEKKQELPKLEPLKLKIVDDDKKTKDIYVNSEADQNTKIDYEVKFEPEKEKNVDDNIIHRLPQKMAEFKGGEVELFKFLKNNINYPEYDKRNKIEGTVYLTFVVEKDGSITNIQILRSVSYSIDEEAIRVLKKMPNWNPGKQGIKKVRVQFNLPIKFILN
ncbi:MAG: energy transducer TonB [Bacteroidetes bacterium]|nr:energy transducer TonB [Bacteroidota bacterium]